jgi:uncharacterized protein YgiM (DUF1202 family)
MSGNTNTTSRKGSAEGILADVYVSNVMLRKTYIGQFKRNQCIRTEPQQDSRVSSPVYKGKQVREIGKMDE